MRAGQQQLRRLTASDGANSDFFGYSVAISGSTLLVGAMRDDDNGDSSGSAYLFDTDTGQELFKLRADDGAAGDLFGFSVAIDGDLAIIGAPSNDASGVDSGAAYVFDTTTGELVHKLVAPDPDAQDLFGTAVAIDGTIAVVGAGGDDQVADGAGAAYVFDLTTGQQVLKLTPDDTSIRGFGGSSNGREVGISDGIVIVGASNQAVFFFDASSGQMIAKTTNPGSSNGFGVAVAISGSFAVVGADRDADLGNSAGAAYLFRAQADPSCPADLNDDGTVDANDFFEFLDLFASGDSAADLTGPGGDPDGVLDADDFFEFLNLFAAGCP